MRLKQVSRILESNIDYGLKVDSISFTIDIQAYEL